VETVSHILWECQSAVDVWGVGDIVFQKCSQKGLEFLDLAVELFSFSFSRLGKEKLNLFVGMARRIWSRRNDVLHGAVFKHPKEIGCF
jgi:hypothetical protein